MSPRFFATGALHEDQYVLERSRKEGKHGCREYNTGLPSLLMSNKGDQISGDSSTNSNTNLLKKAPTVSARLPIGGNKRSSRGFKREKLNIDANSFKMIDEAVARITPTMSARDERLAEILTTSKTTVRRLRKKFNSSTVRIAPLDGLGKGEAMKLGVVNQLVESAGSTRVSPKHLASA